MAPSDSIERLAEASQAGAAVCDGASDLAGAADSRVAGASEADGVSEAQADTEVVFEASGVVLAGDGFDLGGNPQPSSTAACAGATTHAEASAGQIARRGVGGGGAILYLEVAIYDAKGMQGISATDASACLEMKVGALSVNLSHLVVTANYDPVLMAGAVVGAGALSTVGWNERPPRY